jgi:hypothetical protein
MSIARLNQVGRSGRLSGDNHLYPGTMLCIYSKTLKTESKTLKMESKSLKMESKTFYFMKG